MAKYVKDTLLFIWEVTKVVVIALAIVLPIRYFIFQPFFVEGSSMEPNFHNGDYLIVDEISYRFSAPRRGDVIVFRYPNDPAKRFIKRIIGLPGETVEVRNGRIIISKNSKKIKLDESAYLPSYIVTPDCAPFHLGKKQYFVLGDNRMRSFDSEDWGAVPRKYIIGRVVIRAWPFVHFHKVKAQTY